MVRGIIYRYRRVIAWRDLPESFGPWQTVWTWHHRWLSRAPGTRCWRRSPRRRTRRGWSI